MDEQLLGPLDVYQVPSRLLEGFLVDWCVLKPRREGAEVRVGDVTTPLQGPEPLCDRLHSPGEGEVPLCRYQVGLLHLLRRKRKELVSERLQVDLRGVLGQLHEQPVSVHEPEPDQPLLRQQLLEDVAESPVDRLSEAGVDNQVLLKPLQQNQPVGWY